MFLRLLIVANAYEEQVALVVVQGLAVIFVLDLLQGAFGTLVMLQFNDQGRDIRQIRNQYQVCVTFARRQFLHQCVAGVGIEIGQTDGALEAMLIIVGQRVSHLGVGCVERTGHRLLIALDGVVKEPLRGVDKIHDGSEVLLVVDGIHPFLTDLLVRDTTRTLVIVVRQVP